MVPFRQVGTSQNPLAATRLFGPVTDKHIEYNAYSKVGSKINIRQEPQIGSNIASAKIKMQTL